MYLVLTLLVAGWLTAGTSALTREFSQRKILQHRIDPDMLEQITSDFSAAQPSPDLSSLEGFLRRKQGKAAPPPPHPARSEMCSGIPFKRYKYVKSLGEIKEALSSAKPGDLIEVKSGVYFQVCLHRKQRNLSRLLHLSVERHSLATHTRTHRARALVNRP
jgi:hypothetical protein